MNESKRNPSVTQKEKIKEKKEVDPDFVKFWKTVPSTSDPVTMILRCHLLAEFYLDQLITLRIPRGDIITDGRFQFSEKLIIVEALDILDKRVFDSLKKLNSVRNICSHVLDYEISEADLDKLGMPFKEHYLLDKNEYKSDRKKLLHATLITIMAKTTRVVRMTAEQNIKKIEQQNSRKLVTVNR